MNEFEIFTDTNSFFGGNFLTGCTFWNQHTLQYLSSHLRVDCKQHTVIELAVPCFYPANKFSFEEIWQI